MAKGKDSKSVHNRQAYSRMSYLYQAATLFAHAAAAGGGTSSSKGGDTGPGRPREGQTGPEDDKQQAPTSHGQGSLQTQARPGPPPPQSQQQQQQQQQEHHQPQQRRPPHPLNTTAQGTSRRLLADLRSVSLKTQIRLAPALKRTVCRGCDTLLVEGVSCATAVENPSRGGRKPWAALLVRTCGTCGRAKRYPLAGRQETRGRVPRDSREGGQEEEEKKKENTRGANVKTGAVG